MQNDLNQLFDQSSTMRMFSAAISNTISDLDGYGCWCYLFSHGKGKSQPVDEIDSHCKTLQQAYQCVMMEVEEESNGDDSCVPWEEEYVSGVSNLTDFGVDIVTHCEELNDGANDCAKRTCAVEGAFVENAFAMFSSGSFMDFASFSHSSGFDSSIDCPTKKGPGAGTTKACCGSYPYKFPFRTLDGERSCCGEKTFMTSNLQCCAGAGENGADKLKKVGVDCEA